MKELTDIELGWLAGILEGEGCFSVVYPSDTYARLSVVVRMTDRDVVYALQERTGLGKVHGPYTRKGRETNKPIWSWQVQDESATKALCLQVKPHLYERRRVQVHKLLTELYKKRARRIAKYVRHRKDGRKNPFEVYVKEKYYGSYSTRAEAERVRDRELRRLSGQDSKSSLAFS